MRNTTGKILTLATMAALALGVSVSPASAATTDKTIRKVNGAYGTSGEYWYTNGASWRALNSVGAHKSGMPKKVTLYARFLYKKPGGTYKAGSDWKKANVYKIATTGKWEAHAGWGKNDSHTGKKYPKNTVICTQFKGSSVKTCDTLK